MANLSVGIGLTLLGEGEFHFGRRTGDVELIYGADLQAVGAGMWFPGE